MLCPNGHKYECSYGNFQAGYRCGKCFGKKDLSEVIQLLKAENYEFIKIFDGTDYKSVKQKIVLNCPIGHEWVTTVDSFTNKKSRCISCFGKNKLSIIRVREDYKKEGYRLITNYYQNNHQNLESICPNNHRCFISYSNFSSGNRCLQCQGINTYTIESVNEMSGKDKYVVVDKEYISIETKMTFICPLNHKYSTAFYNFVAGHRCPKCSGVHQRSHEEIRQIVEAEGYKKLDNKTKRVSEKMLIKCTKGHIYKVNIGSFVNGGVRCQECAGLKKKSVEEVRAFFEKEGYILVSTKYENANTKLDTICPKGHPYSTKLGNFSQGKRCSRCQIFLNEESTRDLFCNIFKKEFEKCRPDFLLNPETGYNLELDGYNSGLKIAFEYDGEQHFEPRFGSREILPKIQARDRLKDELCKKEGVILIRIPYFVKDKESHIKEELTKRGIKWQSQ
jgi:hypothetical protein